MKKAFFLAALAACTLMGCNCNKNNAECADTVIAEQHECASVAFDSTVVYNLVAINGEEVPAGATIQFFTESGQLGGRSFVNSYGAAFKATPCGKFFMENPFLTQMSGTPEMDALEQRFHQALNSVNRYQLSADKLELLKDETVVLTFWPVVE